MFFVLGFCQRDHVAAGRLLEWIERLGGCQRHDCLLVAARATEQQAVQGVVTIAKRSFRNVTLIRPVVSVEPRTPGPWQNGRDASAPNSLWRTAAAYMQKVVKQPWLWGEPDVVPIRSDWLTSIESDYAHATKPFMGVLWDHPRPHMTGIAVYPADSLKLNPAWINLGKIPWDLVNPEVVLKHFAQTSLIQHEWGDRKTGEAPTFPDHQNLNLIHPGTVLFHRCKDGTLIQRLQDEQREQDDSNEPDKKTFLSQCQTIIKTLMGETLARWQSGIIAMPEDMPVFVQLGKIGDILNVIPMLRLSHTIFHYQPVPMVIHQSMRNVLGRVGYVKPYLWKGAMTDRAAASDYAKSIAKKVLVPQLFTDKGGHPEEWKQPRYNLDEWDRCGLLDLWGKLPLEIDHRDWPAERKWFSGVRKTDKPILCFNFKGISAAFNGADTIERRIKSEFQDCELIDLGSLRGESVYTDILGVLDRCNALITIDTSTLHLAQASHCPYIALVSDLVNGWLGSALRRKPMLEVSYAAVNQRMDEIIATLRKLASTTFKNGRILHCVSRRDFKDDRIIRATEAWSKAYSEHAAIPVHVWSMKRNAKDVMGDKRDLPFLRDVLEVAMSQASDDDIIMLTNDDVVFTKDTLEHLRLKLRFADMVTASRIDVKSKMPTWPGSDTQWIGRRHCGRDLVAWNASWLKSNFALIPDFALGASEWDITLLAIGRRQFGIPSSLSNLSTMFSECELSPGLLFHEEHQSIWNTPEVYNKAPSQVHNQTLCEEWFRANEPDMKLNWFKCL